MKTKSYRKIWETHFGKIPKDENGRSYEIHHIDGNHTNNNIENLKCLSIQEHYNIHYKNGDFGACVMIAKRMNMTPTFLSEIQLGKKRPGIGGVKKGTIPWNKGISGYKLNITDIGLNAKNIAREKTTKIKKEHLDKILNDYKNNVPIDNPDIDKIKGNGKVFTYKRAFCKKYGELYNVTEQCIFRLLKKNVQEE